MRMRAVVFLLHHVGLHALRQDLRERDVDGAQFLNPQKPIIYHYIKKHYTEHF